jgi:hypothetical protein
MRDSEVMKALKAAFTGYERNSNAALLELLSDDFTFEMSDSLPYGGTYIGREEFLGFWRAVAKEWTYFRYDAHEIIDAGDTIVNSTAAMPPAFLPFTITLDHWRLWIEQNPGFNWQSLDTASFEAGFRESQEKFHDVIGTDDPDLTEFRRHGGK